MPKQNYESLIYKNKFLRVCKTALIVLLISAVVLAPTLWIWDQSVQERQALREAKNVVLNMNLLSLEYYGSPTAIMDRPRSSGMVKSAEEEIVSYSGAEGEIHLVSWNTRKNCVDTMSYRKGRFLVQYQYDSTDDTDTWEVYWKIHQYAD